VNGQVVPLRPADARVDDVLNELARAVGDRPIEVRKRGRWWHASVVVDGRRRVEEGSSAHTALLRLARAVSGDDGSAA
jgi:hypothetical protein